MKELLHSLLMAVTTLLLLSACGKNGDLVPGMTYLSIQGSLPSGAAAARAAFAANSFISVKDTDGAVIGQITLTDARLVIRDIKLKGTEDDSVDSDDSDSHDDSAHYRGPYVANLITQEITPALPAVSLPAGSYEKIIMKLHKAEDKDALVAPTDDLYKRSIIFQGTYTGLTAEGQVTDVAFSFSHDLDEEFDLVGPNETASNFQLSDVTANQVVIAFRMGLWLVFNNSETNNDNVDFSNLTLTNGAIVLDKDVEGNNQKIRQVIKKNIKASADYGKDEDGDGELEADEDTDDDDVELD